MKYKHLIKLLALLIAIFSGYNLSSFAEPLIITQEKQIINNNRETLDRLSEANVIYLGEKHDSAVNHDAQLEIIKYLQEKNNNIAIGMEMFQRPFQPILDRYIAGEINEKELLIQSEYTRRWGFDWSYYAPIIRFAKQNQIPLIAMNTPAEITRKVARTGLSSLEGNDFRYIPPLEEINIDDPEYSQMIKNLFGTHSHGNSVSFENLFSAQVLWDETMADSIANFYENNPQRQIIVLSGIGHVIYNYGIPNRVTRRINSPDFKQYSVLLDDNPGFTGNGELADFIWQY